MPNTPNTESMDLSYSDALAKIKIERIKPLKQNGLQVSLIFETPAFGPITVRGFRVQPSSYGGVWVQPPRISPWYKADICRFAPAMWKVLEDYLKDLYSERFPDITDDDMEEIMKEMGEGDLDIDK
jgi:hypothetical protein